MNIVNTENIYIRFTKTDENHSHLFDLVSRREFDDGKGVYIVTGLIKVADPNTNDSEES